MRPYDTVTVRGVPIRRVRAVRELRERPRARAPHALLPSSTSMFNADPIGELTIRVPEDVLDPLATVLELEVTPPAA